MCKPFAKAGDQPVPLMRVQDAAEDLLLPARFAPCAQNLRGYMGTNTIFTLPRAELWYYGRLAHWQDGSGDTPRVLDAEYPALVEARQPGTGLRLVLHDNALHGMGAPSPRGQKLAAGPRPLERLPWPVANLQVSLLYGDGEKAEKEAYEYITVCDYERDSFLFEWLCRQGQENSKSNADE